jgi:hypothetical protein
MLNFRRILGTSGRWRRKNTLSKMELFFEKAE